MKAIIIGSGISGLTTGAFLARAGWEVEIFEQYGDIGGVTGGIEKDGFRWDLGQLILEGLAPGEVVGELLDDLEIREKLTLIPGDRIYSFPGFNIKKPEAYGGPFWRKELLAGLFPDDKKGLERYYRLYRRIMELMTIGRRIERTRGPRKLLFQVLIFAKMLPILPKMKQSADVLLGNLFKSEELRGVFMSILADFVVRPSEFLGLGIPAVNPEPAFDYRVPLMISRFGRQPSYSYIKGGCRALVDVLARYITERGGAIHTGTEVKKIVVEGGAAKGILTTAGATIDGDIVVSSGAAIEFRDLAGRENFNDTFNKSVDEIPLMESVFMVHLGVDYDPSEVQGGPLCYYYLTCDFERGVRDIQNNRYHEGRDGYLVTVGSVPSPDMAPEGHHAVTVYTIAPNVLDSGTWEKRKEEFADKLLAIAEEKVPGLRERTRTRIILTPDDFKKIAHMKHHAFGGCAPVMGKTGLPHQTPVKNLWFIGAQSESGAGINNVMRGGWRVAVKILRNM